MGTSFQLMADWGVRGKRITIRTTKAPAVPVCRESALPMSISCWVLLLNNKLSLKKERGSAAARSLPPAACDHLLVGKQQEGNQLTQVHLSPDKVLGVLDSLCFHRGFMA